MIVKTDCETDGSSAALVTLFVTCSPRPTLPDTAPEQEVSCSGSVVGLSRNLNVKKVNQITQRNLPKTSLLLSLAFMSY